MRAPLSGMRLHGFENIARLGGIWVITSNSLLDLGMKLVGNWIELAPRGAFLHVQSALGGPIPIWELLAPVVAALSPPAPSQGISEILHIFCGGIFMSS